MEDEKDERDIYMYITKYDTKHLKFLVITFHQLSQDYIETYSLLGRRPISTVMDGNI